MSSRWLEAARPALEPWQRGDVEALAVLLDPEVEMRWWEPGECDRHGREAVMALLRRRTAEGPAAGLRPATLITFRDGPAVSMRQFRSRREAPAAAG